MGFSTDPKGFSTGPKVRRTAAQQQDAVLIRRIRAQHWSLALQASATPTDQDQDLGSVRFELTTPELKALCSTVELRAHQSLENTSIFIYKNRVINTYCTFIYIYIYINKYKNLTIICFYNVQYFLLTTSRFELLTSGL